MNNILDSNIKELIDYAHLFPDGNIPIITRDPWEFAEGNNWAEKLINIVSDEVYIGLGVKLFLGIDLFPFQITILRTLWTKKLPIFIATRGGGKSFLLAVYAILRSILDQGTKVVIVAASFRQSKIVFNYIHEIWNKSPVLQSMTGTGKTNGPKTDVDMCRLRIGDSMIMSVPLGDGTKIRGLRANIVLVDEYASVPEEILNVVVKGFGVVSRDPVEEVKQKSLIRRLKEQGQWDQETQDSISAHESMNQIIYSGTANYQFNHFFRDFTIWKAIIESKGDTRKLARKMSYLSETYGYKYDLPDELSWRDYAIIRLPHHALPEGFLKEDYIAGIRASMHTALYHMEYGCIFKKDSMGFYRRSLIENATTNKPLMLPGGEEIEFTPLLRGISGHDYIMGIDPAAEHDNFAIVILEVHPTHRRIVYCWATNKKDFNKRRKAGQVQENEYYSFCGRKIKQLVRDFRIVRIEIDAGGGGTAIGGCLMNQDLLEENDTPIYEIKNVITPNITDTEPGLHILHYVKATTEWNSLANHTMKADLENKKLLFPKFDVMSIDIAQATDLIAGLNFDNMEDNTINIEELKNEMTNIIISATTTGKERFDVPQKRESVPDSGRKKITSLRKDRFSALLMVNLHANEMDMERFNSMRDYEPIGGITIDRTNTDKELYTGMSRFVNHEDYM